MPFPPPIGTSAFVVTAPADGTHVLINKRFEMVVELTYDPAVFAWQDITTVRFHGVYDALGTPASYEAGAVITNARETSATTVEWRKEVWIPDPGTVTARGAIILVGPQFIGDSITITAYRRQAEAEAEARTAVAGAEEREADAETGGRSATGGISGRSAEAGVDPRSPTASAALRTADGETYTRTVAASAGDRAAEAGAPARVATAAMSARSVEAEVPVRTATGGARD